MKIELFILLSLIAATLYQIEGAATSAAPRLLTGVAKRLCSTLLHVKIHLRGSTLGDKRCFRIHQLFIKP